jgi:hypothetical protein
MGRLRRVISGMSQVVHGRWANGLLRLVRAAPPVDSLAASWILTFLTRHDSCSIFAAGIILLVNTVEYPDSLEVDDDQRIIDQNLQIYERLLELGPHEESLVFTDFHSLRSRAGEAVKRSTEQRFEEPISILPAKSPDGSFWGFGEGYVDGGMEFDAVRDTLLVLPVHSNVGSLTQSRCPPASNLWNQKPSWMPLRASSLTPGA